MLALGKPLGRFHNFRHVALILESMDMIIAGDSTIRQCVCIILELAPYRRRRCCIPGGERVDRTALLMADRGSIFNLGCAFAQ